MTVPTAEPELRKVLFALALESEQQFGDSVAPRRLFGRRTCCLRASRGPTSSLDFASTSRRQAMRTLLIGVAAAGFVAAVTGSANAQQSSTTAQGSSATQAPASQPSATQAPSSQPSATQAPSSQSSATQTPSTQTETTASANKELSGVVKKIDKDKRSLKISSPAGVEQEVKLAASATITRDGAQAGLDQLKEGDDVRASFDPSSNQATKLEVRSKQMMMEKDKKTESKGK
jgi:Cu/Ag efflux protein CusF